MVADDNAGRAGNVSPVQRNRARQPFRRHLGNRGQRRGEVAGFHVGRSHPRGQEVRKTDSEEGRMVIREPEATDDVRAIPGAHAANGRLIAPSYRQVDRLLRVRRVLDVFQNRKTDRGVVSRTQLLDIRPERGLADVRAGHQGGLLTPGNKKTPGKCQRF